MNATAALPVVGVDLAKSVFQIAIADAHWRVVEQQRLTRTQMERWFANRAVGLVVMGAGAPRVIPARSQPHHLHAIIAELETSRPAGATDVRSALAEVAGGLHRRGLCILISDLLDDPQGLEQGLRHLHHRRHDLMVLHLADRDELELPFRKLTLFRDLEGALELTTDPREIRREYRAAMEEHLAAVRALCRRSGADYDLFVTDQPLDRGLVRYLARREG